MVIFYILTFKTYVLKKWFKQWLNPSYEIFEKPRRFAVKSHRTIEYKNKGILEHGN